MDSSNDISIRDLTKIWSEPTSQQRETIDDCLVQNANDSFLPCPEEEDWSDLHFQTGSPHEAESFLSTDSYESGNSSVFDRLRQLRNISKHRPIIGYLNVNSIRYKFHELREIFDDKLVDIFTIAETKIDSSFNSNLFSADGYKLDRRDRNAHGGGIMTFIRSDLPVRRRPDLECNSVETLCFELEMGRRKWGILSAYRSPSTPDSTFENDIISVLDKLYLKYDHVILYGDLNYDALVKPKHIPLNNIQDVFNLTNMIKQPTCFTKNSEPSLLDVILTNSPNLLCNTTIFNCGISDCHCMVLSTLKENLPAVNKKKVAFRSYKNFDEKDFHHALSQVPFHIAHVFDEVDDIYATHESPT